MIVNLDKAPRNARGMVEYEADFFLMRPLDAARGNHKIIFDVTNRGRKIIHWRLMDAKPASVAATNRLYARVERLGFGSAARATTAGRRRPPPTASR